MRKASNVFRWLAVGFLAWVLTDLLSLLGFAAFCLIPVVGWIAALFFLIGAIMILPVFLLSIASYVISIIVLIKLIKNKQTIALAVILTVIAVLIGSFIFILGAVFALISAILKNSADKKEASQVEETIEEVYYEEEPIYAEE